jgi:SpoVK/Ycf46/Vps4 family AAA+-type ATPase
VYEAWGFTPVGASDGVVALFHGASGTGKTMAAEVLARELGLDLYRIDLAGLVSKYIGETEKNLRRVFQAAAAVNAILLFDEAEALFGRRSEVKDAHDRYANIETAYLLGELETFPGLTVLATNLATNIDDAFRRRIHVAVEFPMPDVVQREQIWRRSLGPGAPRADDVDLRMLAQRIEISGAVIRSACLGAAFAAAENGGVITLEQLVRATAAELEKLGRPPTRGEFGELHELIAR